MEYFTIILLMLSLISSGMLIKTFYDLSNDDNQINLYFFFIMSLITSAMWIAFLISSLY